MPVESGQDEIILDLTYDGVAKIWWWSEEARDLMLTLNPSESENDLLNNQWCG